MFLSTLLLLACSTPSIPSMESEPKPPEILPAEIGSFEPAPAASPRLDLADTDTSRLAALESWFDGHKSQRLYVQVDKPLYQPGDTIWVQSWNLNTRELSGSDDGLVKYELVGPRGEVVRTVSRIRQTAGRATNNLDLGSNISGGLYTVRATTAAGVVGEREVVIAAYERPRIKKKLDFLREGYGPGDQVEAIVTVERGAGGLLVDHPVSIAPSLGGVALPRFEAKTNERGEALLNFKLPDDAAGTGLLTVLVEEGGVTESISRPIPLLTRALDVQLFPEGGDLVTGLDSRVYVQVRNAWGEPADATGRLVAADGTVLSAFRTVHDGLGRFDLPATQQGAHIELIEPAGQLDPIPLPTAVADGCVLRHFDDFEAQEKALRVSVHCSSERDVVVVSALREKVLDRARVHVGAEGAVVHLDGDNSRQGAARVTVLDTAGEPLAERLVYRNKGRDLQIAVTPSKTQYGPRDEVQLTVTTKDPTGEPLPAHLALSVVDDTVLSQADDRRGNLLSRVYLEPELPTDVHEPKAYFDPEEEDAAAALDMLMGTAGWRHFAWKKLTGDMAIAEVAEAPVQRKPVEIPLADLPQTLEGKRRPAEPVFEADQRAVFQVLGTGLVAESGAEANPRVGAVLDIGDPVVISDLVGSGGGLGDMPWLNGPVAPQVKGLVRLGTGESQLTSGEPTEVPRTLRRYRGQLTYCYESRLKTNPALQGRVDIRWKVADGRALQTRVSANTTGDDRLGKCIEGKIKRWRYPPDLTGEIEWPFYFTSEGRPATPSKRAPVPVKPTYARVRVFPQPNYQPGYTGYRSDFRETVLWAPNVQTDDKGEATVSFFLSDAVTSFRITAEGTGAGVLGHSESLITATRPFSMDVVLPVELSTNDQLQIPVVLSNTREQPTDVELEVELDKELTLGEVANAWTLAAGEKRTVFVPVRAELRRGSPTLRIIGSTEGLSDSVSREVRVTPRGFPVARSKAGTLDKRETHRFDLGDVVAGSAQLAVTLYPSPLADMDGASSGIFRSPSGCFEQASSRNYPNVMMLQYMSATGRVDSELNRSAMAALKVGYGKLAGYESPSGGFDWWGRDPGHPALTAYGLLQFSDMARVYPVDSAMMGRSTEWLLNQRDSSGFLNPPGVDRFGRTPDSVRDAYITWALVSAGRTEGLTSEIAKERERANRTTDAYELALATLTLLRAAPTDGRAAATRLAAMQDAEGSWSGATTITRSGPRDARVETSGLAVLALIQAGGHNVGVAEGLKWLTAQRTAHGTFGSTQATILALKAIVAAAESSSEQRPAGTVRLLVNGEERGRVKMSAGHRQVVELSTEEGLLDGEAVIELVQEGGAPLPYALDLRYRTATPQTHAQAPVGLSTELSTSQIQLGETVRLTSTVLNQTDGGVASVLVQLGLPANAEVQQWQLEELVDRKQISAYETQPRTVVLYLEGLEKGQHKELVLDLTARIPGTAQAPASKAQLYYDSARLSWAEGTTLEVVGP